MQTHTMAMAATDGDVAASNGYLTSTASAQFYSGFLYAYTGQSVDKRDYIVGCSVQMDALDDELTRVYSDPDDSYAGRGSSYLMGTGPLYEVSMADCDETEAISALMFDFVKETIVDD